MARRNLGIQTVVNTNSIQGWKLGTTTAKFSDKDINKAVVLDTTLAGTLKLAASGDDIRGFVESIEPATEDGQTFGSVITHSHGVRQWVTGSGLALGDLVVADTQTAAGEANALAKHPLNRWGLTPVKKGQPTTFRWQVIYVQGTDLFLIEAI